MEVIKDKLHVNKPQTHTQLRVSIEGVGKDAGANMQHTLNRYPNLLRNGTGGPITISWDYLRQVRRDPTISLAREMRAAMILSAEWGVELQDGGNEKAKILVEKTVLPLRTNYLRTAIYGEIDFGWRAYEKLFKLVDVDGVGNVVVLDSLKPLLNDNTFARTNAEGDFIGFLHKDIINGYDIYIDEAHSLFVNFDDDGLGNYNDPGQLRCIEPYEAWRAADSVARRYDEKIAGAVWHLSYPEGSTRRNGEKVDNYTLAQEIMSMLKASGHLITPSKLLAKATQELEELGQEGWKIELIEAGSKQADFISRLKYLDTLKARGLYILERAVFEGQFGTKAEAGVHTDAMMMIQDLKHQDLTNLANKEIVNQLTAYNFDTIDEVKLLAKPLTDERTQFFATMMTQMISNPNFGAEIISNVDIDEFFRILHIPKLSDEERAKQNTIGSMFEKIGERLGSTEVKPADGQVKEKDKPENAGIALSKYVQGVTLAKPKRRRKSETIDGVHINPTRSRAKLLMSTVEALHGAADSQTGDMYFWSDGATVAEMSERLGVSFDENHFYAENDATFYEQWLKISSVSLTLGPYEEIEGLAYDASDSCGAGSAGGKGFEPGNTCARRGNDRFAKGQKTLIDPKELEPVKLTDLPLREAYETVKPKIDAIVEKHNGEDIEVDEEAISFSQLDEEVQSAAYDSFTEGDMNEYYEQAMESARDEITSNVTDQWESDDDGAAEYFLQQAEVNATTKDGPVLNDYNFIDAVDGEIHWDQATWSDDDEFIALKSEEAGQQLTSEEMAPHNQARFEELYETTSDDITSGWNEYKDERIQEQIDEEIESNMDSVYETASELQSEHWGQMSDEEKMEYVADDAKEAAAGGGQITIPEVWCPVTSSSKPGWEGANEDDYADTQRIARLIQRERTVELLQERFPKLSEHSARQYVTDLDAKVWSAWKTSSVSDYGKAIQLACVDELGAKGKPQYEKDREKIISAIGQSQYDGLKAYLRGTWESSQYVLDKAGVEEQITTWRAIERPREELDRSTKWHVRTGVKMEAYLPAGKTPTDPPERTSASEYHVRLPDVKLLRNGAQSASAFPETPNSWNGVGYNEFFDGVENRSDKQRVVLRVNNNREDVLSLPVFGQNVHSEAEVITLGTEWREWEAWLDRAPTKTYEELSYN